MSKMRYSNERMGTAAEVLAAAAQVDGEKVTLYATADATEPLWCCDCDAAATLACANDGHDYDADGVTLWTKTRRTPTGH